MPFLLRVRLPDVPGSLGRLATAIGEAGGDIQAIEFVEHSEGCAVDDVLLELEPGTMPDSIVSACNTLDGVEVLFISRYAAGGSLMLDLEAVEELTKHRTEALNRVVDLLPHTFRADWAARVRRTSDGGAETVHATPAAPDTLAWHDVDRASSVASADENTVLAAARLREGEIILLGRRGGPEILESELARLSHLVGLAVSISRS